LARAGLTKGGLEGVRGAPAFIKESEREEGQQQHEEDHPIDPI